MFLRYSRAKVIELLHASRRSVARTPCRAACGSVGSGERALHRLEPLLLVERLRVRGQADADAVHQVRPQLVLLRVERGDEQRAARVADGEPLALDRHPPRRQRLEQQVRDRLVEQVDVVDVQHAAVRRASSPGSKIVFPVLTDFSTSTAPRSRSSSTSSGTCTKGAGTTSVSRLSIVNSPLRSCSSRKESYSPEAGSLLNWLPFITSIGGSNLWIARAITDFAVPREPEMTTPPIFWVHAAEKQRSLDSLLQRRTDRGERVGGPEFRSVNAGALPAALAIASSSAAVISPATAIARSIASVVVMHIRLRKIGALASAATR